MTIASYFSNTGTIALSSNDGLNAVLLLSGGGISSADAFVQGSAAVGSLYLDAIEITGTTPFTITGGTFGIYAAPAVENGGILNITGNTTFTHGLSDWGTVNIISGATTSDYNIWGFATSFVNIDAEASLTIASSVLSTSNSGASADINFNGPHATLTIGTPATFNQPISGFAETDVIDLAGTMATSATLSGGNLVVRANGTGLATIPMSGLPPATQFSLTSDGSGGTLIGLTQTVAAALSQPTGPSVITSVIDSAANVVANLDGLESLATTGMLSSIALTDSGTPILSLTVTQLAKDCGALGKISGNYTVTATGGATAAIDNFLAQQDTSGRGGNGIAADYAGLAPPGGMSRSMLKLEGRRCSP